MKAPGSYRTPVDVWDRFDRASLRLPPRSVVVIDHRVSCLHPRVLSSLGRLSPLAILEVRASERLKSVSALARVLSAASALPRSGTLCAIGGGTVGDLATVAAHLSRRGVALIHVPTTLLAAVDSSVGGKGAIHSRSRGQVVKNAAGVFHYPVETWLCEELLGSLTPSQMRQGWVEALKMELCIDGPSWNSGGERLLSARERILRARLRKDGVCRRDPYETLGHREVLNFGHTFGHVLESLSHFRVPHGDAVAMGILCALDVGQAMGITPPETADQVENVLEGSLPGRAVAWREQLQTWARRSSWTEASTLIAKDKKVGPDGRPRMVLLERPGRTKVMSIDEPSLRSCWKRWARG